MSYKDLEKNRAYQRKWKKENPDKVRDSAKKYYNTHKKQMLAYGKKRREAHKEEMKVYVKRHYQEYREQVLTQNKNYREKHPEKCRDYKRKRRARKNNAPGSHTPEQITFLRNISGGFCPGHNKPPHWVGKKKLTTDHVIPLSKGGSDSIQNIQMMCRSCNSEKHDSLSEGVS